MPGNPDSPGEIAREKAWERIWGRAIQELTEELGRDPTEPEAWQRAHWLLEAEADDYIEDK